VNEETFGHVCRTAMVVCSCFIIFLPINTNVKWFSEKAAAYRIYKIPSLAK
jgi:hypothetical protein